MKTSSSRSLRGAFALLCLACAPLHAQERAEERPTPLDTMRMREDRERQEQDIQRELEEERARQERQLQPTETPTAPVVEGESFYVHTIVLEGDERVSKNRQSIISRYENTQMGATHMLALVKELTDDYAGQGFVTTTVTLAPQNIKDGTLVLRVHWGKVKDWRILGPFAGTWREKTLRASLPKVAGDRLNIRDVDQAVEALNNGMTTATINVVAADELGVSWLDVMVQPRAAIGASISIDNSGQAEDYLRGSLGSGERNIRGTGDLHHGRYRANGEVSVRGFGADVWSIGGTHRYFDDGSDDLENSANVSVSAPLGYWSVEARQGMSRYRKLIKALGTYTSKGVSADQSLKLSRTLMRSSRGKTSGSMRISRRDSENYVGGFLTESNSKRYTDLALGLSHIDRLWGGALYADFNWTRGLPWLGANDLAKPQSGRTPALYYKWSGNLSWNRGFKPLGRPLDYSTRIGWQYGPHHMLAANQLTIGDEYTVRGFKGESLYGDNGLYVSNTLTTPLFGRFSMFTGLDAGAVRDWTDIKTRYLSGVSAGVRAQWQHGGFSLTAGFPLRTAPGMSDDPVLYMSTNLRF